MSDEAILDLVKILFPAGVVGFGTGSAFIILLLFFPEKVEKWRALVWSWIEATGLLYRRASKEKIKHNIQGTVSSFAKDLGYDLPDYDPPGVKIEWVEQASDRKAFIESGKAVIRLRREDPRNENIAAACMLYVSAILLRKAGRYLSSTQREAVELYVGFRMLQDELEEVLDVFVDKWLFPGIEKGNEKISTYFERFRGIDAAELFTPVFLQELIYMGEKVFGRRRDDSVMREVDSALEFLELHAQRKLGEHLDMPYFDGEACRFAIMIVGIPPNIDEQRYDVYFRHITERLLPCGVETIYMVGPAKNIGFIAEIARLVEDQFNNPFTRNFRVELVTRDGARIGAENHLSVLRRRVRERYVP